VLRGLGLSPAVEEAGSAVVHLNRTAPLTATGRPVYSAPRTALPDADVTAQLAVLRRHAEQGASPNGARPAPTGGEEATQLGLETLHKAIRLRQKVVMNVVDSLGNAKLETVVPVSVTGGRVRVFDPAKDTERVLSIHRIIDIEAAEEMQQ
jgi:predicted DNA-binding transcriptional regulator YafY